ncbi:MAG TPA: CRISPR-associated endonuclease Cas6 [Gemmataceae bacterium]|nr:CRISPR-associated endonuclease Cas6 [Gemmataceae bacterium]
MSAVDLVTVRFSWAEEAPTRLAPHLLRGAVAEHFLDNPLFHQHDGERLMYRYPQVQYRWDREGPMIVALGEAARFLAGVDWPGMELRLGEHRLTIRDAVYSFHRHEIRPSPRLIRYRFIAPWLPLSQENYQCYRSMNPAQQVAERDRLAVAGLLISLRGFGVDFPGRLYAAFELHGVRTCHYKGVDLLGFHGRLLANVDLPDGFALGRAVSHGYGWLYCDTPHSLSRRSNHAGYPTPDRAGI